MKILLAFFLFHAIALAAENSSFDQFKVEVSNVKMSKELVVDTDFAKKYQKILLKEFDLGPNFANNFRLVVMNCDKICKRIIIINNTNGKIFDPNLSIDGSPAWIKGDIVQFKKESRLLIMQGCLNEDNKKCGHHEYSWDGENFKMEFFRESK